ncbi:MAG: hypothetical protein KGL54_11970 [Sphingomonadales bacterium]|nr:hypothetical protein [Sphingomonadales bacterium]
MASLGQEAKQGQARGPNPDRYEQGLAIGAVPLLVAVLVAVGRGRAQWLLVPAVVWLHLIPVTVALALTPVILLRRRGDRLHRRLGWVWAAAMAMAALASFAVRTITPGRFSLIHLLSVYVLIQLPALICAARRHDIARHRKIVRGMVTGALLIAGFFTFPFHRLLGQWLLG